MTGYGRGECSQDGFKITVELSSVNRKQAEVSVNLPRQLEMLVGQLRDVVNRAIVAQCRVSWCHANGRLATDGTRCRDAWAEWHMMWP